MVVAAAQETRAGLVQARGTRCKVGIPDIVAPRSLTDSGSGQLGQALGVFEKISADSCVIRVETHCNVERLD
jgi:hypothetical protein